jgi:NAD(P)-dependent dehydrogenase (short-subunit alcohol dehydrogenase family)
MGRLDGKVAVITGASTGIGRATFELFAREGATVVGASRTQSTLDEALAAVHEAGGKGSVVAADLSADDGAATVVDAAVKDHGRIDILVNNAGVGWAYGQSNPGAMEPLADTSPDWWRKVMSINLDSYFFMTRRVLPHMISNGGGAIVMVASMGGVAGLYDSHAYTATKGAVVNLSRSLAITYIKQGVRTNTVCPGFVDTNMIKPVMSNFDTPEIANALTPIGRAAAPEEIATANLFFASDDASYCNGSLLMVDGGCTARAFPG